MMVETVKLKIKNKTIEADVANDMTKRVMGLSLCEKKNMFFPMPYEDRWSLWMFAVRYPLTMIFIGRDKKVVDVHRGVPITPDPKTWKTYTPKKKCKYVLETPFKVSVKIGDKINW
jgi:uncharacterized membrane protein (UPF0127 family)